MTVLLSTLLLLAPPGALAAPLPAFAVVKVESRFRAGSDNKLEGSGLLFRKDGELYVITSEHVVIPGNEGTVHRVRNNFEIDFEATWQRSSWELGLALLKVNVANPSSFKEVAPDLSDIEAAEGARDVHVLGYPSGVREFRQFFEGRLTGLAEEGSVLYGTPVAVVRNTMVEFGMSGGPALAQGGKLAGIITHITYEDDPLAFLIPGAEALAWIKGSRKPEFARDVQDFRNLNFSKQKPEAVTHVASEIRLEKRDGHFLVILNDTYSKDNGLEHVQGLGSLLRQMRDRYVRIAEVTNVPKNTTLAQFVHMFNRPVARAYRDFERGDNGSLSDIPSFFPKAGQQAVYDVSANGQPGTRTITAAGKYPAILLKESVSGAAKADPDNLFRTMSSDLWRIIRSRCPGEWGEALEEIEVPAGKFLACRSSSPVATKWFAAVPTIGVIRSVSHDGKHIEVLRSVKYE